MKVAEPLARRGSIAEDVADQLLDAIRRGTYVPGERLPTEPELAQMLGVGRTTLREGISKLRLLGVVEVKRGLGTFVREASENDARSAFGKWSAEHRYELADLFEMRAMIEGKAAGLAAERITGEQSVTLQGTAAAHERATRGTDIEEIITSDEAFHRALIAACNNEVVVRVYGELAPQFNDYRRQCFAIPGAAERSCRDHSKILDEVLSHRSEAAHDAALSHIDGLHRETLRAEIAVNLTA